MKTYIRYFFTFLILNGSCGTLLAHEGADPLVFSAVAEQFELRAEEGVDPLVLEGQAWLGYDLHKLWLKVDLEQRQSELEELELQALYSRAIAPYWDLQAGLRQDVRPEPSQTWGVVGLQGLAPYFFEIDLALFVGGEGATAARVSLEYELLFSQSLILSPEVELNFYGQNDAEQGHGSGLADASAGLRLRYEIRQEFAPYVGIQWTKKFGSSTNFARAEGEEVADSVAVIGLRFWF